MFDSETRWFIRCDTCRDQPPAGAHIGVFGGAISKDWAKDLAVKSGWDIHLDAPFDDGLHRCPRCSREGRTEMAR